MGGSHLLQQYQRSEWCRCKKPLVFGKEFELCVLPVRKSLRVLDFLLFSVFRSSSFVFFSARRYFPFVPCITGFVAFVFAILLSLVADSVILLFYFVSVIHPPRAACEPRLCPCVMAPFLRSCCLFIYFVFFAPLRFRLGHRFFHSVIFSWACMLSPRFRLS